MDQPSRVTQPKAQCFANLIGRGERPVHAARTANESVERIGPMLQTAPSDCPASTVARNALSDRDPAIYFAAPPSCSTRCLLVLLAWWDAWHMWPRATRA